MNHLKGLIPAAGFGIRLYPLTLKRPKHLLPILSKPVIFYVIQIFKELGISEIGIVVNQFKDMLIEYIKKLGEKAEIKFHIIKQKEILGLANAVYVSREFIEDDSFLVINGDAILEGNFQKMIDLHKKKKASATLGLVRVPNPWDFGVIELEKNNIIKRIVEKPKKPFSDLASASTFLLEPEIFEVIENLESNYYTREQELTDAISKLVEEGKKCYGYTLDSWIDVGRPWDVLNANMYMLEKMKKRIHIGKNSKILKDTQVRGPVFIGNNTIIEKCAIKSSYIGNNVIFEDSISVENSVIYDNTAISKNSKISNSVIGFGCKIGKNVVFKDTVKEKTVFVKIKGEYVDSQRKKLGAIIGDNIEIKDGSILFPGTKIPS